MSTLPTHNSALLFVKEAAIYCERRMERGYSDEVKKPGLGNGSFYTCTPSQQRDCIDLPASRCPDVQKTRLVMFPPSLALIWCMYIVTRSKIITKRFERRFPRELVASNVDSCVVQSTQVCEGGLLCHP